MARLDAHRKLEAIAPINPLAAWLVPSVVLIGGLLGVALMAALMGTSQLGGITDQTSPELPVQGSPSGEGRLVGLVQLVRNSPYGQP